jgi:hypothetical protein
MRTRFRGYDKLDVITREIEVALKGGFYYLAIIGSLTLPDICSALESQDGTTSGKQYMHWCDSWLLPKYPFLTSSEIYSLRCGVIHQGNAMHPSKRYSRILFTLPVPHNDVFLHNNILNDALNLDAVTFCRDVLECGVNWYAQEKNNPHVVANLPNQVRYYPKGIAPYIVGVPVIS